MAMQQRTMGLECQTVMKRLASAYIRFALRNAVGKVLRTALAASDGEAEASDGEAEASDGEAEVDAEEVDVDAEEAEEAEEVVVEEAAAEHPPEPAAWLMVSPPPLRLRFVFGRKSSRAAREEI